MSIQRFARLVDIGVAPMAVLQKMCTEKRMDVQSLQHFVHHCVSSGISLQRESAEYMIESFTCYSDQMNSAQYRMYERMYKAGTPIEAIQQRASLDGNEWTPNPKI